MGPTISVKDLSLSIAGNSILQPLSTELGAGQLHLLIGPNGAGKTSLLKSLLGLTPYKGEVLRHWQGPPQQPAYIPQQPRFDQVLPVTVADFLLARISQKPVFFKPKARDLDKVEQLLAQVGLSAKQHLQLGQLSGGERQRLMFAQALSCPSSLWFLDEPMTGLDTQGQQLITELICSLRAAGHTLIMVHHDMNFVAQYADNLLIVNAGLQAQGSPTEIKQHDELLDNLSIKFEDVA